MNNSGVVHLLAENDEEAMYLCRRLLSFLPSNNLEDPPRAPYDLPIESDPGIQRPRVSTDMKVGLRRARP